MDFDSYFDYLIIIRASLPAISE